MGIAESKATATALFERLSAGDIDGVLALMTDDAIWWMSGKPGKNPSIGEHPKQRIGKLFHRMLEQLPEGLQMQVKGMVAEGDKVAVEVESRGRHRNGRLYEQQYHMLIELRDGRIRAVREYLDTQHVLEVWFA